MPLLKFGGFARVADGQRHLCRYCITARSLPQSAACHSHRFHLLVPAHWLCLSAMRELTAA